MFTRSKSVLDVIVANICREFKKKSGIDFAEQERNECIFIEYVAKRWEHFLL